MKKINPSLSDRTGVLDVSVNPLPTPDLLSMTTKLNSRRPYFILSCARSGSTSITRILDQAANGRRAMEPMPNLNVESRDVFDGRRHDVDQIVARLVAPRVERGMRETQIYGEKNVTYGPFVTALYRRLRCKFIFLTRDSREVVRSLLDWHDLKFGSIYRECREVGQLNGAGKAAATGFALATLGTTIVPPSATVTRPGELRFFSRFRGRSK